MKQSPLSIARLLRLQPSLGRWLLLGIVLGLLTAVASVGLLTLAGWFISAAALAGLSSVSAAGFDIFRPGAMVRFFALLRTSGRYGERVVSHDATLRLLAHLRVWFYRRLEPLAPARLFDYRSGDLLNRIVTDIDVLDQVYLRLLSPSLIALIMTLLVTLFLAAYDLTIALSTFLFMLLGGLFLPILSERLGRAGSRGLTQLNAELRSQLIDYFQALAELLACAASDRQQQHIANSQHTLLQLQQRQAWLAGGSAAALIMLSGLATMTALYLAIGLFQQGTLAGASLALISLCILAAFETLAPLASAYQYLGQIRAAAHRLLLLVATEPSVRFVAKTASPPPAQTFDIQFEQVSFRYGARPLLQAITLAIPAGQKLAILGPTGVGKSTLGHLLARFWDPQQGRILLGGVDIRSLSESDLRSSIAVLPQRPHIFNASIGSNLRLARPEATDAELRQVLAEVQLLDFVDSLPAGLDTFTGEAGMHLSGGQQRRLALARTLLRDAPVIVLDEPTEGLDAVTEQALLETLTARLAGRTVVLITHRLSGLEQMDSIVLLEAGRIIEQGTHCELLTRQGRYAALQARVHTAAQ
ncbi:MAG: cysteine/glutathione ABC transporter ATP-binding protein/permease CydC [Gammaproteobacteria bacterium]